MKNKVQHSTETLIENNSFLFEFFLILFKPSNYISDLTKVDFNLIRKQGTKLIICDLDNTLVPHFTKFPTTYAKNVVESILNAGIEIIIISNNSQKRVSHFAKLLGVDYIYGAKKPFIKKISKKMEKFNYSKEEVLMIGDMLVMDIIAANRMGYQSILVRPIISYNDSTTNKVIRWLEKNIFKRLERNNLLINDSGEKLLIYEKKFEII